MTNQSSHSETRQSPEDTNNNTISSPSEGRALGRVDRTSQNQARANRLRARNLASSRAQTSNTEAPASQVSEEALGSPTTPEQPIPRNQEPPTGRQSSRRRHSGDPALGANLFPSNTQSVRSSNSAPVNSPSANDTRLVGLNVDENGKISDPSILEHLSPGLLETLRLGIASVREGTEIIPSSIVIPESEAAPELSQEE